MKNLITIVIAFFAYTGIYAQCNLSITNNTATSISLLAAQSTIYSCASQIVPTAVTVGANAAISVTHTAGQTYWLGIHTTSPVNEAHANYLASSCTAGSGTLNVVWIDACTVMIN